ncbi:MAG: hypothetical protein KY476_20420 [Planctomycetes bacterium]|nr:hypothetical protein [Planctomycetota bacterium]
MLRHVSRLACAAMVVLGAAADASAQFYPGTGPSPGYGGSPGIGAAPFGTNPCECLQPVVQSCYQTVPVTEYREVRQTVQRPVVERQWVDREFTEYQPVTETRTAEIPTIAYDNVLECRTVQRDMGRWATNYYARPQMSPCEYDPRPGLFGWMNRAGYSIRNTFTPKVITQRQWVPNVVAQAVPVYRQVARRETRQVTYNVTRMVPHTTTRKVAVDTVRYVSENVVRQVPVTVMRTVPIGSSLAFSSSPTSTASRTALQPTPDPSASRPGAVRSADSRSGFERVPAAGAEKFERRQPSGTDAGAFEKDPVPFGKDGQSQLDSSGLEDPHVRTSSFTTVPDRHETARPVLHEEHEHATPADDGFRPTSERRRAYPSVVRVHRATAQRQSHSGPTLTGPGIQMVGAER